MRNKEINLERLTQAINSISKNTFEMKDNILNSDLVDLKEAVSPINNFITQELTKSFIKSLPRLFKNITEDKVSILLEENELVNVNGNGFDFVDYEDKIIAEMKANRPYDKKKFGAAQKTGLDKDVKGLISGKTKSNVNVDNYFKFLVLMSYEKNGYSTFESIINYCKNNRDLEIVTSKTEITRKDKVYVLILDI